MPDPLPDCLDAAGHSWTDEGTLSGFRVCERCGLHTLKPAEGGADQPEPPAPAPQVD